MYKYKIFIQICFHQFVKTGQLSLTHFNYQSDIQYMYLYMIIFSVEIIVGVVMYYGCNQLPMYFFIIICMHMTCGNIYTDIAGLISIIFFIHVYNLLAFIIFLSKNDSFGTSMVQYTCIMYVANV